MKTALKTALFLLLAVALAIPVMAGTVYRWVDSSGVVHYSDQPHPGAQRIDLEALPVVDFNVPAGTALTRGEGVAGDKRPVPDYRIRILAPADGTTLRPANNEVHARVKVTPPLAPPALLRYQLDGEPLGEPTSARQALIKQVYRGTHTLTVRILTGNGKRIDSASSTFYVHQHSILNNPGGGPGPHPGPGG